MTFDAIRQALARSADCGRCAVASRPEKRRRRWQRTGSSDGALWLEAPLPPEDPVAHGRIWLAAIVHSVGSRRKLSATRFELAPFFRAGALGYVQPDLGRTGLTEGRRISPNRPQGAGFRSSRISASRSGPQIAAAIHFAAGHSQLLHTRIQSSGSHRCEPVSATSSGGSRRKVHRSAGTRSRN